MKMKKILILGGSAASVEVVATSRELGYFAVVADDRVTGPAKEIADQSYVISTTDIESLALLVEREGIDGVFCGPSEFNLKNCMALSERTGLPFYCTRAQWDRCSDKSSFREMCIRHDVPCVPGYDIPSEIESADLSHLHYPVMVKPVDGASSRGVRVCHNAEEVKEAYRAAVEISSTGRALVERYIDNSESGFTAYYIVIDGRVHLTLTGDKLLVDPKKGLHITAAALFPSQYTDSYLETIHPQVAKMIKSIGMKNGVCFLQALVTEGQILFHEMGLRLSGGLMYKLTDERNGVNDLKMMIRHTMGERMCSPEEESRITPYLNGVVAGSLCVPLGIGTVSHIGGVEDIISFPGVIDVMQNYAVGDEMTREKIGTLPQLFGRFKFMVKDGKEAAKTMDRIQDLLIIRDKDGHDMIYKRFDSRRLGTIERRGMP